MGEATFEWGIRACLRQGGLSRNKVSVGEPADGSPPKKPEAGALLGSSLHSFFYFNQTLLFTLSSISKSYSRLIFSNFSNNVFLNVSKHSLGASVLTVIVAPLLK